MSVSDHPSLYKDREEEWFGSLPRRQRWGLQAWKEDGAEAGIWRESPGHGGMSFTQPGLPSAGFVHLAPTGFPGPPPQPTRHLLLL